MLRCLVFAAALTLALAGPARAAGDFCACEEGKEPPACPDKLLAAFGAGGEEVSIKEEGDKALWALECAGET